MESISGYRATSGVPDRAFAGQFAPGYTVDYSASVYWRSDGETSAPGLFLFPATPVIVPLPFTGDQMATPRLEDYSLWFTGGFLLARRL